MMNRWAYRNCCNCGFMDNYEHFDDDSFWRILCPDCGDRCTVKLCRRVLYRVKKFSIFNPFSWSWFPYEYKDEFK